MQQMLHESNQPLFFYFHMSSKTLIAPTKPFKFKFRQIVTHKNGGTYVVLGLPNRYRIEENGKPAYAYRAISVSGEPEGCKWIRAQDAMEDGRFTAK